MFSNCQVYISLRLLHLSEQNCTVLLRRAFFNTGILLFKYIKFDVSLIKQINFSAHKTTNELRTSGLFVMENM